MKSKNQGGSHGKQDMHRSSKPENKEGMERKNEGHKGEESSKERKDTKSRK